MDDLQNVSEQNVSERNVSEQNISEQKVSEQNISATKRISHESYRQQNISGLQNVLLTFSEKRILMNDRKAKHRWREYAVKDMP